MMNRDVNIIFSKAPVFFLTPKDMGKWMQASKAFSRAELNTYKMLKPDMKEDMLYQFNIADDKTAYLNMIKTTLSQYSLVNSIGMS